MPDEIGIAVQLMFPFLLAKDYRPDRCGLVIHDGHTIVLDTLNIDGSADSPTFDLSVETLFGEMLIITSVFEHLVCGSTKDSPHLLADILFHVVPVLLTEDADTR